MTLDQLKFPIGQFEKPMVISKAVLSKWIDDIATFPARLNNAVKNLSNEQLNTPYRQGGWTVRQVVHHCADSHINSLTRFKLCLTEERPTIKPYFEDRWAELADSKNLSISPSLKMLEGTHERWVALLNSLTNQDLAKTFVHPEHNKEFRLNENIGLYAWHCNHHLAHISTLKQRENWA